MRNRQARLVLAWAVAFATASGCGAVLDPSKPDIGPLREEVRAYGGDVVILAADRGITIDLGELSSLPPDVPPEASAISVVVPRGAIAPGIDDAALMVLPIAGYGDVRSDDRPPVADTRGFFADETGPAGPVVQLLLFRLSSGVPVDLRKPLRLTVPYFASVSEQASPTVGRFTGAGWETIRTQPAGDRLLAAEIAAVAGVNAIDERAAALAPSIVRLLPADTTSRLRETITTISTLVKIEWPAISKVTPDVVAPGDTVLIEGSNFSKLEETLVLIDGLRADIKDWKTTAVQAIVPPDIERKRIDVVVAFGAKDGKFARGKVAVAHRALDARVPDADAPATLLTAGPAGTTGARWAKVYFQCSELDCTFECSLDAGPWVGCLSPWSATGLSAGPHSLRVRATDAAGNAESAPPAWTWMIDLDPPTTSVLSAPPAVTSEQVAKIIVEADEPAGFECRMNEGLWHYCGPIIDLPTIYAPIWPGLNRLEVRAEDLYGNREVVPVVVEWTVDPLFPTTSWLSTPSYWSNSTAATFHFEADEPATFECQLTGDVWQPCTSPWQALDLADGIHTAQVRATDLAGNPEPIALEHVWTVDTIAPQTLWQSTPALVSGDDGAAFTFACDDAPCTFVCRLDGAGWSDCNGGTAYFSGLSEGAHLFEVRASDRAGNLEAPAASYAWTVDTAAPGGSYLGIVGSPEAVSSTTLTLELEAAGAVTMMLADNAAFVNAQIAPFAATHPWTLSMVEGAQQIWARLCDAASNCSPALMRSVVYDATPPLGTLQINGGALLTGQRTVTLTFDVVESGSGVNGVFLANDSADALTSAAVQAWSASMPWTLSGTGVEITTKIVHARVVDRAGHQLAVSAAIGFDNTALLLEGFSIDGGATRSTDRHVALTLQASGASRMRISDRADFAGAEWRTFAAAATWTFDGDQGPRTLWAQVGNELDEVSGALSATIDLDALPPDTWFRRAPSGRVSLDKAELEFNGADNRAISHFECRHEAGSWQVCASPWTVTDIGVGEQRFEVRAVDAFGVPDPNPAVASFDNGFEAWQALAAGGSHNCAIDDGGALYCWGANNYGQTVGAGTVDKRAPLRVGTDADWTAVAAGADHSCAVRAGLLYCWGRGADGRLGNGGTANVTAPVLIGAWSDWQSVAGGGSHTCGIRAGGLLYCWGLNTYGQLGLGHLLPASTPQQVGTWSDWQNVSAGTSHSCAMRAGGSVYCWGRNTSGQVGDGSTVQAPSPVAVGVGGWTSVRAGGDSSCGLIAGELHCWGEAGSYQLGNGGTTDQLAPLQIGVSADWTSVAMGVTHACGVRDGGALYCWGNNSYGRLGDGTTTARQMPVQVDGSQWQQAAIGANHTCAIGRAGSMRCWGYSANGQLGDGAESQVSKPMPVASHMRWTDVAAGINESCAVRDSGELYCWGAGRGPSPVRVGVLTGWEDIEVSIGGAASACAVRAGGELYCWAGTSGPVRVGAFDDWMDVSVGGIHQCARRADGALYCWGDNSAGLLADGTTISSAQPKLVTYATSWRAVDVFSVPGGGWFTPSSGRTCGVRGDGGVSCWQGSSWLPATQPVEYSGSWNSVAVSSSHTCGLQGESGYCWGTNAQGQVGDGSTETRTSPVVFGSIFHTRWRSMDVGTAHSCGIQRGRDLYCWGYNRYGQLGAGGTADSLNPAVIGSATDWQQVSTGANHTCGIRGEGRLYCWGDNRAAQLGLGAGGDAWTPRLIAAVGSADADAWRPIDAGCFVMGDAMAEGQPDEGPVRSTCVSAFDLYARPVTNGEYENCVTAGNCSSPQGSVGYGIDDHEDRRRPVGGVTWTQAQTFCAWRGGRLPTEAEWEYAARGGVSGERFPWGNAATCDAANFSGDGSGCSANFGPSPTDSYAANAWGLHDMAGNVWEWVSDRYQPDAYATGPVTDPTGPVSGSERVVRGGAFDSTADDIRVSRRLPLAPSTQHLTVGFRCAR